MGEASAQCTITLKTLPIVNSPPSPLWLHKISQTWELQQQIPQTGHPYEHHAPNACWYLLNSTCPLGTTERKVSMYTAGHGDFATLIPHQNQSHCAPAPQCKMAPIGSSRRSRAWRASPAPLGPDAPPAEPRAQTTQQLPQPRVPAGLEAGWRPCLWPVTPSTCL